MRIKSFFQRIPTFFSEVKKETKKVAWPSRKQTLINTLIVIGVSIVIAIYLGGIDAIMTWLMGKIIR
ncbi:MAG: preprotein translocase subunit SecE [Candidatus Bathyarchaeota archaeon]|nr:preprotein translocase subunit SecE [Candidatus Bathyarchaeota archaeon]